MLNVFKKFNSKWWLASSLFVTIFAFFVYISPYLVTKNLLVAINGNDMVQVEEYVDFTKLRKNLKAEILTPMLLSNFFSNQNNDETELFNTLHKIDVVYWNNIIDGLVTPEGLSVFGSAIINSMPPTITSSDQDDVIRIPESDLNEEDEDSVFINAAYENYNTFTISIIIGDEKGNGGLINVVMTRENFFYWKIVNVKFINPDNGIENSEMSYSEKKKGKV